MRIKQSLVGELSCAGRRGGVWELRVCPGFLQPGIGICMNEFIKIRFTIYKNKLLFWIKFIGRPTFVSGRRMGFRRIASERACICIYTGSFFNSLAVWKDAFYERPRAELLAVAVGGGHRGLFAGERERHARRRNPRRRLRILTDINTLQGMKKEDYPLHCRPRSCWGRVARLRRGTAAGTGRRGDTGRCGGGAREP